MPIGLSSETKGVALISSNYWGRAAEPAMSACLRGYLRWALGGICLTVANNGEQAAGFQVGTARTEVKRSAADARALVEDIVMILFCC